MGKLAFTLKECESVEDTTYRETLNEIRFAGDSHYMIIFDALIAFTYAFHVHAFIRQTRFTQNDIENCGKARCD